VAAVVVTLIRHGEAAAGWGDDPDPGLSERGRAQAEAMAAALAPSGPLPILVSPLRRTRETAAPLEAAWDVTARVEPAVGEIVAPAEASGLEARSTWLRSAMAGRWDDLDDERQRWRTAVADALLSLTEDTVVVTHFVAINAAVGAATGDDRVVSFSPGNCSRTTFEVADGRLRLVDLGSSAVTEVL
jgi:broad specificity phosphatase PhoE